jgi:hypothetical protein
MTNQVLETLLSSKSDYFLLEFKDLNRDHRNLVLIAITNEILQIIADKTIDTITYKDVEAIKRAYIDTNIYINADLAPFQGWQNLFGRADTIMPMGELFNQITLKDILNSGVNSIHELKKHFKLEN